MEPTHTLLLVDDDELVRRTLRESLSRVYRVLAAADGSEALALLEHDEAQLVLSDQRMPGISGAQLCARIRALYPNTIRIIMTGFGGASALQEAFRAGDIYYYLMKPCNLDQLRMLLQRAAEAYDLMAESRRLAAGGAAVQAAPSAWTGWTPARAF